MDPARRGRGFDDRFFSTAHLDADLRRRSIRAGSVTVTAQALRFVLQTTSTVVLARLLTPAEFGLVAMVIPIMGFLELFTNLGLAQATVQRAELTHPQVSTVFWVNLGVGAGLMTLVALLSPFVATFYQEPQLRWITFALALGFVFSALGIQHQALLRRHMRFGALAAVEIGSYSVGLVIAIVSAWYGLGAWSLIVQRLTSTVCTSCSLWFVSHWRPGFLFRWQETRSMLAMGGHLTGFSTVNYVARNADNVLIGRWWGPGELGFYSRAYQLLLLPLQQINSPISSVAIPTLSRLQRDPVRFRSFYLRALGLVAAVTMPLVFLMVVLSQEIVRIVLGPQWDYSATLFRLLAVAMIVQPTCSTAGWIYVSLGRTDRMFRWGLFYSALVLASFFAGISHGASGVATCYSAAMLLQAVPCLWFATRGTTITLSDIGATIARPTVSALLAAALSFLLEQRLLPDLSPWLRAVLGGSVFALAYAVLLLLVFRQLPIYRDILNQLRAGRGGTPPASVSTD